MNSLDSPPAHQPLIALLTDFGTHDPYVGVMKGVILARVPPGALAPTLIDLTHDIAPQNIAQGAYLLRSAYPYFPPHTVFLVVVDPGVGTERRPVFVRTPRGAFVGPDNGVLRLALDEIGGHRAFVLRPPDGISATFHGRDVFAPAAADLAYGRTPPCEPVDSLSPGTPLKMERIDAGSFAGEVIHLDRFGNIITSLGPFNWQTKGLALDFHGERLLVDLSRARVRIGAVQLEQIRRTYGQVSAARPLALISSDGQLEIAINQGNAAARFGVKLGDDVRLQLT